MSCGKCLVTAAAMIATLAILSCNSNETDNSKNDKTDSMDTVKTKITNRINGPAGSIHIDDGGTGGLPVLFLHSFGGSSTNWKEQLNELRKTRRVIAMDFRGHGKSDIPADNDYSTQTLANDVAVVADSLGLGKFVLIGHSMGGSAAIAYAGEYPHRVAGLVMVGTPGKMPEEMSKPIIASLEADTYQKVMDDYMKKLFTNARPETQNEISAEMKDNSKEKNLSIIRSAFQFDPLPSLKKYDGPKLIISATAEKNPNSLASQNSKVPNKIIDGTSHWVQMDKPAEFNTILKSFLDTVENKSVKK